MIRATALSVVLLLTQAAGAADWPQWRGPNRDGLSLEVVEPWQGPLPVAWRQAVGEGHSSPIVAGGRVFIHAKVKGEDKEEVLAYDAMSGKEFWRATYDCAPFKSDYGNGPRATPLVDGDRLYTLGVTGNLACWEAATGKQLWAMDILKAFHATNLFFGVSSSPVIDGDKLLVMVGAPEASIVAFDKLSGKGLWKSGSDKATYASPIVTTFDNRKLAVFLTHDGVTAIDPADGKRLWQYPLVDRLAESSTTAVRVGETLFASSVTFGSVGLKLTGSKDQPGYEQLWKEPKLTCYFSTPVAVGEHLYVVTGQFLPVPAAHLHCVEVKTGKILWTHKNVGKYHATVMLAKDRLLLLEEEGDLVLIEPSSESYKELARTKVCGHTWVHPALSDGRLFVRDDKELICLSVGKSAATLTQEPATLEGKIDRIVQPFLDQKKAVGIVVGVLDKDGRHVFGYGKTAVESDKKPDGDTVFEIGSISKVFTAILLANMAEEGLVKLDDPVQKYLPESVKVPRRGDKEMTLLHLATHTSGLPRVPLKVLFNTKNPYADFTPKDLNDFLGSCKLLHDVGDKFDYSNLGGGLLGHVLSLRANQSYEELIARRIAEPLGMKSTGITLTPALRERLAAGYTADGKPAGNWDFGCLAGCGALRSTANDLLAFAAANLEPDKTRLGPALTISHQPRHDAGDNTQVGLGWMLSKSKNPGKPLLWHDGGTGGYSSFLSIDGERGTAVVVLTNAAISLNRSVVHQVGLEVAKTLAAGK